MSEIEELECSICYNKIGEKNNCTTSCGHSFCLTCIIEVIRRDNNSCPNCRTALFTEEDDQHLIENNIINYNNNNIINNNIINDNIINDNIFDDYLINNVNIQNNRVIITDDDDDESILSHSEYSTSISDIHDEELHDDNYYMNSKLIRLYNDNFERNFLSNNQPIEKIIKVVSILLKKGFDESSIRYIIRKNFNYNILTEDKECDNQELIFSNKTFENINILQGELDKILYDLEVEENNKINKKNN
jgi:hypothetical protein